MNILMLVDKKMLQNIIQNL